MKITIVTPSFNQAEFLEETMLSILNQEDVDLEYIVMDGGSTDGSVDIIKKYSSRLKYWISEKDKGQADAIKRGLQMATGDIMGYVNSDDILYAGALKHVVDLFQKKNAQLLYTGGVFIDRKSQLFLGRADYHPAVQATFSQLLFHDMEGIVQPGIFWTKELYLKAGPVDDQLRFVMDLDLLLRLTKLTKPVTSSRICAGFRIHENSKSMTIQNIRLSERELLRKRYGYYATNAIFRKILKMKYRCKCITLRLFYTMLLRMKIIR
jgi:glycosyltransferase involved in cell wall biosynthesis